MIHLYKYLLRGLYNQKGRFYVDNIHLDIVLPATYLVFLVSALQCSPVPHCLPWLFSLTRHTCSIVFSLCALTVVTPSSWPFVLF